MSVTNFVKAVKKGHMEGIGQHWAKCNKQVTHEEASGKSIYHLAIEQKSLPLLEYLAELTGADPDLFDHDGKINALSACILNRFPEGLPFLARLGANIDACNVEGYTPLMLAAGWGTVPDLQALLKLGARVDFRVGQLQAVHIAALSGKEKNAVFLLAHEGQWELDYLSALALQHNLLELQQAIAARRNRKGWNKYALAAGAVGMAGLGAWAASSGITGSIASTLSSYFDM
jgi:ankyrin repeat protein